MRRILKWAVVTLLLLPVQLMAQTGYPVLDKFFSDVKGFEADFIQTVFDEKFREVQKSTGKMALKRPDNFRWTYVTPYAQLIVGDGKEIWIYDPDLEQVTVKSQGETLGETPAQLLSSNKPIVNDFSVTELVMRSELRWYELVPLEEDNAFMSIRLGFQGETLTRMELQDSLGNRTLFEYSNVVLNPPFAANIFTFTPPDGVDVIGRE